MTYKEIIDTIEGFRSRKEDIDTKKRNLLRKLGWEETCDGPGSYWLFQKKLPDGRIIMVDKSTALGMEESIAHINFTPGVDS